MAEFAGGTTALRGARSQKDSTVYNRGGYRAAPPIYETGEDGNLRQTTGNPARAAAPTSEAAPAFTKAFADVPRPQASSMAGSLAQSAVAKGGEALLKRGYNSLTTPRWDGEGDQADWMARDSTVDLSKHPLGGSGGAPTFGTGSEAGDAMQSDWLASDATAGAGDAIGAAAGATSDAAGNAIGWGLDGAAGDAAAGAAGDAASGGIPFLGAGVQLAQGNVGGAVGSVIGNLIAPGIGGVIGGLIGGGGGRVICTELVAQGRMEADMLAADLAFTATLHPAVIRGYHWWAVPYVRLMRKSPAATELVRPFALWRGRAVLHAMGLGPRCWQGDIVRAVGEPLCHLIGLLVGPQDFTVLQKGDLA